MEDPAIWSSSEMMVGIQLSKPADDVLCKKSENRIRYLLLNIRQFNHSLRYVLSSQKRCRTAIPHHEVGKARGLTNFPTECVDERQRPFNHGFLDLLELIHDDLECGTRGGLGMPAKLSDGYQGRWCVLGEGRALVPEDNNLS